MDKNFYLCVPMMLKNKAIIASILFALTSLIGVAQDPPGPPPPPGLPVDSGIMWLLLAGLLLGIYKLTALKR